MRDVLGGGEGGEDAGRRAIFRARARYSIVQ